MVHADITCLVKNALPNAPQDKIIALLCDLVKSTDLSTMGGSYLAAAQKDIDNVLCEYLNQRREMWEELENEASLF
ncbi:hypothetical protein V5799_001052 [Amblyomma americanum]|uniref:Uncharacterized protein n=2 Tax=Amblyomma americanum TaxID=6943 RepID=A0AAQ4D1A6_AMBAM